VREWLASRRRRRQSHTALLQQVTPSPAISGPDSPALLAPSPFVQPDAEYESWTEDDDDDFEYEKEPPPDSASGASTNIAGGAQHVKWRHRHCGGRCCSVRGALTRGASLVMVILLAYLVMFVRVVPGARDALEVEFGTFGGGSFGGVPIPESLHPSLHALMGHGHRPGIRARKDGLRAHFPIVFVPGIVSTGLELWEGEPCARAHFRQRLWGSTLMLRSILLDSRCWLRHLSLDGWTGLDPEGIKLRPASGLEAADYLVGGFWIWAKLIENFADVGYDVNSMFMAPYDWRLSMKHLQLRDYYFSKLKYTIEIAKLANHNRKVVLIAHSVSTHNKSRMLEKNWWHASVFLLTVVFFPFSPCGACCSDGRSSLSILHAMGGKPRGWQWRSFVGVRPHRELGGDWRSVVRCAQSVFCHFLGRNARHGRIGTLP
jgi:hypothetical protein